MLPYTSINMYDVCTGMEFAYTCLYYNYLVCVFANLVPNTHISESCTLYIWIAPTHPLAK